MAVRRYVRIYSGDLQCISDLGVLVFINICDVEQYIAGVVRTEGGPGKRIEYLKSQAVIARTFMYKHFERHLIDRYNLCDNTHCQAFNGISTDTLITRAALETKGLVVLDRDSTLDNLCISLKLRRRNINLRFCMALRAFLHKESNRSLLH